MRSRRLGAVGVLMALGALVLPSQTASANHAATLEVEVGAFIDEGTLQAESLRFYPADVTVHKGDTLKFMGEFHVPLLLPTATSDADAWIAENAADPSDPYFFIQPNPDLEGFGLKLLGDNGFTPRTDCGSPDQPCSYTGAEVIDVRAPLAFYAIPPADDTSPPTPTGFSVTVDVEPGESFWVIDKLFPESRMRVVVVNPNEESTTQEDIDEALVTLLAEDTAAAKRLHDSLSDMRRVKKTRRGRVFTAYAGYDTDTLALYEFYPQRPINLRKGDRVKWLFSALNHEVHSVSGPVKKGLRLHDEGQPLYCDPNGDETSGGETPPTSFPPFCDPGVSEQLLGDRMMGMAGDGVITSPTDLGHSGVRGPDLGDHPYTLKFKNKSGTAWKYLCVIHPDMRATVKVR